MIEFTILIFQEKLSLHRSMEIEFDSPFAVISNIETSPDKISAGVPVHRS